jgi:CubicO group peptidase (beta-lactamase class C family)
MKKFLLVFFTVSLLYISCENEKKADITTEINAIESGLLPIFQVKGDSTITYNILDRMEHYKVPGVSISVVENGEIKWAKGYGIANTDSKTKVDVNTIFQAGSISKPVAALSALKLVEEGKLDLDTDVNTYLKDWQIPANKFTATEKVTLRRLLTHTAGMTVHGFPGYEQKDSFPTINQVLNGQGNTPKIFVDTIPNSIWRYSGGDYTLMEKIVEDTSNQTLDVYIAENFLTPLGMNKSTYEQPLSAKYHTNASAAYNSKGEIAEGFWNNYPEQAAAGLWTTPTDLAKYAIEVQQIHAGKENGILSKKTIDQMLTKHKNNWGLGPSLQWEKDSLIFRHGGKNRGFTNELISFANKGSAVIIMTNADNGGKLISEILRSISKKYNWGINKQKIIETIEIPIEKLNSLTGKYKLNFQVNGIGDYLIDVKIENNKLIVNDPNNGEINILAATKELNFIDLASGDTIKFTNTDASKTVVFNNRFTFNKMED